MAHYRFVTDWHAIASVDRVWDVLLRYRDWPSWWRGFRAAEQLDPGDEQGVGMRIRQRWRSLLPYTLRIDLEITEVQRKRRLVGRVSGDLTGTCTWLVDQVPGGTRVRFVMDVRPGRWWMDLPVPLAGRVIRANYDAIMRWGGEGLSRVLLAELQGREPLAELAAA